MKCTVEKCEVKSVGLLIVGIDVGKSGISFYSEVNVDGGVVSYEGGSNRNTSDLRRMMKELNAVAAKHGMGGVLVLCEATGGLEKLVFRVARGNGCHTGLVSGQSVGMLSKVESNDTGKTDSKDARTIYLAGKLNRTLTQRDLPDEYHDLQCLNRMYEEEDTSNVRCKGLIVAEVEKIFPDFPWASKRLYGNAGQALIRTYGCDPLRIVADGRDGFEANMRSCRGNLRSKCLDELWHAAVSSSRHMISDYSRYLTAQRIIDLNDDHHRHLERKLEIRNLMLEVYNGLPESVPLSTIPECSEFLMARVIAETGPLKDFADSRKLVRFAGLNLRERQSGKYKGKTRITKRGNSLLRKVLYQQVVTQMSRKGRCYHEKYQKVKTSTGSAIKSAVCIMRHFLKMIFSMTRRNTAFNLRRLSDGRAECASVAA